MDEPITFWLDNKICSGFKAAEIGSQTLVSYRDKYYVVVSGAALMKGVKPLHYSKTSMPPVWKKALKGIMPQSTETIDHPEDENLPATISTKKERTAMQKMTSSTSAVAEDMPRAISHPPTAAKKSAGPEVKPAKIIQSVVAATCPYCSHKQELPFEKGKNGKPFFVACVRCSTEFAVRFVPVTMYQAQVAAFK